MDAHLPGGYPTPSDAHGVRTYVLSLMGQALVCAEQQQLSEPVCEVLASGRYEVRIEIVPRQQAGREQQEQAGRQQEKAGSQAKLTPLDRAILGAASSEPQTMTRLAHGLDHDTDSYFRGRVRRLVGLGLLDLDYRGYRLHSAN